jgi:2-succinyl-6-hydroxy-2,4-cyclohexadiene-1-carboxylate synthase
MYRRVVRGLSVERLGTGRRLVLIHGFSQTGRSWAGLTADLAGDHEVVLVDTPGHGGSADLALDLPGGAEALVAAAGPGTYVGYSMGGRLALHAALDHPGAVERLVLLGATAGIEDGAERAARRAADETLAVALERDGLEVFLDRWLSNPLFAGLPADAAGRDERLRNTVAGLASSLRRAGTGSQADLWPRLGELAMPVLVVAGEHDAKFRLIGERMARAIGTNATFAVVPGAGHAAHLEAPQAFLALLRGWFTQV